jgi:hypothetical protein
MTSITTEEQTGIGMMSLRNELRATPRDVDALFPGNPQPLIAEHVSDMLQSQLTNAFEAALCEGMLPTDALAVMLSWMSSEMMRIQVDGPANP